MALKFNNIDITQVFFNGQEKMTLNYNGTAYFGKRFTLTKTQATGATVIISRTSSPNQKAATGTVSVGNTIYYGDVITMSVTANSGYTSPTMYVDIGDGNGSVLRTSPFSFTVTGNVSYSASATVQSSDWQTVFSGTQMFTEAGSFTVSGIGNGGTVQITANVTYVEYYVSELDESIEEGYTYSAGVTRSTVPVTINGEMSSVGLTRSGNQISVSTNIQYQYAKGYYIYDIPVSIVITEVRWKA